MKNELGIEVCCKNCTYHHPTNHRHCDACIDRDLSDFCPSFLSLQARIKELQEQQFTEKEASTVLVYMKQANLIIKNENARIPNIESIFSKLKKMKG